MQSNNIQRYRHLQRFKKIHNVYYSKKLKRFSDNLGERETN